jgi:streptogramin lyase
MRRKSLHVLVARVILCTVILISISGCATRLLVVGLNTQAIHRYDGSTGASLGVFVPAGSGGLGVPFGLVYGPDRKLYVTSSSLDSNLGQVHRYDGSTGEFIDVFVPLGSGGLSNPIGLTFGPDCSLYVTNRGGNSGVLRYQGNTGAFVDAFVPSGGGGLANPFSLVFGPDRNLYVTDHTKDQVLRYDGATGVFLDAFVPAGGGGLAGPTGLAFGPDGNLYVAGGNAVRRYVGSGWAAGAFIDVFVPGGGGLKAPMDLVFGPDGDLYVTSSIVWPTVHAVDKPDPVRRYNGSTGALVEVFVEKGSGGLHAPIQLAFIPRPVTKQIDSLLVAVRNLRLPSDTGTSLSSSLRTARTAVDTGQLLLAQNQLEAFTVKVRPDLGKLIPEPQGNRLISAADAIRAQLRCL